MIKIYYYAYLMWGLGLIILILRNVYISVLNYDPIILALIGMAFAFPFYLFTYLLYKEEKPND
jgi:hypothetical protein